METMVESKSSGFGSNDLQADAELSLSEFTTFLQEIRDQPAWRAKADREMDYCDGNQLDSEILARMSEIGIPPAVEPLMGPTIDAVLGLEVKNRGDWKVLPDAQNDAEDVADALNYKLHQAEARSGADVACSEALSAQIKVGIGWVYVGKESDPFLYPYKVEDVHRNEIFWDWFAKPDLANARYLIRRKWFDRSIPKLMFPDHAELIEYAGSGWLGLDHTTLTVDGGTSTGLYVAEDQERGWSIEEQEWRDMGRNRVCLFEVWYRRWDRVTVLKSPDGRVVEYDKRNAAHVAAVAGGMLQPELAIVARVRLAWWMGPHKLSDTPSPYRHNRFPYVPFWGKREDRTGAPFALARGMIYLQDQINALHSKSQWMMSARRVVRTKGAVIGPDELFRQEVARPDADIVLDAKAMREGGIFKVETDLQLTQQQFQRLHDSREGLRRVGGIYSEFQGQNANTTSGVQFNSQVEQSNQSLADILDNFKTARTAVGELLLSLIIEDSIGRQESVFINGKGIRPDKTVVINEPALDDETGVRYLNNDIERVKLKVAVDNVPSAVTFKQQQLSSMAEAFKSAPPQFQPIMLPYLLSLMDIPDREDMVRAIKEVGDSASPEQVKKLIDQAVEQALIKARHELEMAKIKQQQPVVDAQVRKLISEAVNKGVEGMFSATQAANQIALMPTVAPVADQMLRSVGMHDYDQPPIVGGVPASVEPVALPRNTDPLTPTNPAVGLDRGIKGGQQLQGAISK
ncbi:MAG TPA: hypothetical protein PKD43_18540 [Nitrospira sp.]|uniref:portal protein n=1 Tax=Accumulibacter sp. TaxID=2053492 RepID=UPI002B933DAC|nr:hypothetical protein [Accumulibacter sp.]HMU32104.1 hypothetical protein [Nitrospira sp.]HND40441.1 hypothetical protein [Accumulibacter sp.]HNE34579.1 hypothetical protein [Nitrospira sp.]